MVSLATPDSIVINDRLAAEAAVQKFMISVQCAWVGFAGHRKIDELMASLPLAVAPRRDTRRFTIPVDLCLCQLR